MPRIRHIPKNRIEGEVVRTHSVAANLLPTAGAPPNAPFWLMHHANLWKFESEMFRPRLNRFMLKKGLRNIVETKSGRLDTDLAVAGMTRKGWIILKHTDPRLGEDGDFLRSHKLVNGRTHYASKWQIPRILGTTTHWGTDVDEQDAAYRRWVDSGVIPNIDPAVAEGMILMSGSRVRHLEELLVAQPGIAIIQARHTAAKARYEAMQIAYDLMFDSDPDSALASKTESKGEAADLADLLKE